MVFFCLNKFCLKESKNVVIYRELWSVYNLIFSYINVYVILIFDVGIKDVRGFID